MTSREPMKLRVQCYSGYRSEERPLRFFTGQRGFEVLEILDRWYDPSDEYFKVLADDGNHYILRHRRGDSEDCWTLEAFRKQN